MCGYCTYQYILLPGATAVVNVTVSSDNVKFAETTEREPDANVTTAKGKYHTS